MTIAFPAPEVETAIKGHVAPSEGAPAIKASRLAGAGRMLQYFRERAFSSILDADGDCMHL